MSTMALQRSSFLKPSSYGVRTHTHILPASYTMIMNCSSSPTSNREELFKPHQLQTVSASHLQLPSEKLIQDRRLEFGQFVAREAVLDEEYWTAAWLRAESHWEEQEQDRYVDTYKRKYAEQEYNALKRRCKAQFGQKCTCVVVTANKKEGDVRCPLMKNMVGTLDLVIGQLLPGETFLGEMVKAPGFCNIDSKTSRYGYIANLCVAKSARRQGIASNMLHFAITTAKASGADLVFVHVHRTNNSAQQLYSKVGFQMVEEASLQVSGEQPHLLCIKP
ncbi:PREDICTED: uncharacterized protein LOC109147692 isoform X2 [Ipomoea nil]|uniref:uncharacterized protein LOC109147692 isoform X2 n=1 Tax=Ipomoea nil TaxID=35883 RepID=UPI0009018303|nr:PREDICTED: uncharacterized protein LOC109147692 isoform X2 [Ipomoea nil]